MNQYLYTHTDINVYTHIYAHTIQILVFASYFPFLFSSFCIFPNLSGLNSLILVFSFSSVPWLVETKERSDLLYTFSGCFLLHFPFVFFSKEQDNTVVLEHEKRRVLPHFLHQWCGEDWDPFFLFSSLAMVLRFVACSSFTDLSGLIIVVIKSGVFN